MLRLEAFQQRDKSHEIERQLYDSGVNERICVQGGHWEDDGQ